MAIGSTPALRGYRLQFIYTLHALLSTADILHLEGYEDLDVLDPSSNALTVTIQVKALDTPLQLADLQENTLSDTTKRPSFLQRFLILRRTNPAVKAKLISYGQIGPELRGAWNGEPKDVKRITDKLVEKGFSKADAAIVLAEIELEVVDEQSLTSEIENQIRKTAASQSLEHASNLLMIWMYQLAERSQQVTREEVVEKLNNVGRYLSQQSAYAEKWFKKIFPLAQDFSPATDAHLHRLKEEFAAGVGARYEHICAQVDVARPAVLEKITNAFNHHSVVIIKGASGQGKTTAALRWIHDRTGSPAFEVRALEGFADAQEIAWALRAYAEVANSRFYVLYNVVPLNQSWADLASELSRSPNIRSLITVREDDWNYAAIRNHLTGHYVLDLELNREEASEVFVSLPEASRSPRYLGFEDVWADFKKGPLLEFVHLCTSAQTLSQRLEQQIRALSVESGEHLAILRAVSIADSLGARLDTRRTIMFLDIKNPVSAISRLEREFFVREDSGQLTGTHRVRSELSLKILRALEHGIVPFEQFTIDLTQCVYEPDRYQFCLRCITALPRSLVPSILATQSQLRNETWSGLRSSLLVLEWVDLYVKARKIEPDVAQGSNRIRGNLQYPKNAPSSPDEWITLSEVLILTHPRTRTSLFRKSWSAILLAHAASIPAYTLAVLYAYLVNVSSVTLSAVDRKALRDSILQKLGVFSIETTEESVSCSYIVPLDEAVSEALMNRRSVEVCMSLRLVYPGRATYSTSGLGHGNIFPNPYDPTRKAMPVQNIPNRDFIRQKTIENRLRDYHERLEDWRQWTTEVVSLRNRIINFILAIDSQQPEGNPESSFERLPRLPKCAYDEWGLTGEPVNTFNTDEQAVADRSLALQPVIDAAQQYNRVIDAVSTAMVQWHTRSADSSRLAALSMSEACTGIVDAQALLRKAVGQWTDNPELDAREVAAYDHAHAILAGTYAGHSDNIDAEQVQIRVSGLQEQMVGKLADALAPLGADVEIACRTRRTLELRLDCAFSEFDSAIAISHGVCGDFFDKNIHVGSPTYLVARPFWAHTEFLAPRAGPIANLCGYYMQSYGAGCKMWPLVRESDFMPYPLPVKVSRSITAHSVEAQCVLNYLSEIESDSDALSVFHDSHFFAECTQKMQACAREIKQGYIELWNNREQYPEINSIAYMLEDVVEHRLDPIDTVKSGQNFDLLNYMISQYWNARAASDSSPSPLSAECASLLESKPEYYEMLILFRLLAEAILRQGRLGEQVRHRAVDRVRSVTSESLRGLTLPIMNDWMGVMRSAEGLFSALKRAAGELGEPADIEALINLSRVYEVLYRRTLEATRRAQALESTEPDVSEVLDLFREGAAEIIREFEEFPSRSHEQLVAAIDAAKGGSSKQKRVLEFSFEMSLPDGWGDELERRIDVVKNRL